MADERTGTVWMVGVTDWDCCNHYAVFAREEDARAFAATSKDHDVFDMPLYPAGVMPAIVEAWSASASVRRHRTTATTSSTGGPTSTIVYDNEPPTVELHQFSELAHIPAWARQPCEVTNCEMTLDVLYIRFHGSDRDAVLAACTARYEGGLDAMGARR